MTISYPLSLPSSQQFTRMRFGMRDAIGVAESPFTYTQEVYEHDGKRWEAQVDVIRLDRASAEEWLAFLGALNGRKGTFLMGDPAGATARGALGGSPVVDGAGQTGQSLNVRGCTAGVTNWLRKGDYIQIGTGSSARLYKSLSDVNSDGSGKLALDLWPGVRSANADGTALVTSSTVGLWRLRDNLRDWEIAEAIKYGISFAATEAL